MFALIVSEAALHKHTVQFLEVAVLVIRLDHLATFRAFDITKYCLQHAVFIPVALGLVAVIYVWILFHAATDFLATLFSQLAKSLSRRCLATSRFRVFSDKRRRSLV